ncbi:hypothetical protein A9X06_15825 [Mycobacterium sp. 852002-51759_SCH5129042]|nr:hypothetical protein A9X06_15825 [Mycobacterium sp. 852002-51759_SCH5129042]
MSGIDDARGDIRTAMLAAMQGATSLATILNASGREGRDVATFIARQRRDEEIHQRRLRVEDDKRQFQSERHDLNMEKGRAEINNTVAEGVRKVLLDQARGIEIVNRVENADAENGRKAEIDAKRLEQIQASIDNDKRIADAKVDTAQGQTRINQLDLRRRNRETRRRISRDDAEHDQRMAAATARLGWGEAKHNAEMAEIYQRMYNRSRRWGLSEQLARSDSAAAAGMRTASAFAAAYSTREWGDRERQNAADFAERAAEDGVSPEDLVEFVHAAANDANTNTGTLADGDAGLVPPEQELAEQLVVAADDARRDPEDPTPMSRDQQIRDTLDAAGLTDQRSSPAATTDLDPPLDTGPAVTTGTDLGPE